MRIKINASVALLPSSHFLIQEIRHAVIVYRHVFACNGNVLIAVVFDQEIERSTLEQSSLGEALVGDLDVVVIINDLVSFLLYLSIFALAVCGGVIIAFGGIFRAGIIRTLDGYSSLVFGTLI